MDGSKDEGSIWLQDRKGDTWIYGNDDEDAYAELRIRIKDGAVAASEYAEVDFSGVDFIV
jgi:hypothetical protein